MPKNNKIVEVKDKVEKYKKSCCKYCNDHKEEIKLGTICAGAGLAVGVIVGAMIAKK